MIETDACKPTVIMWKSVWLPRTETFVASQLSSLEKWDPIAMGSRLEQSALVTGRERILFGSTRAEHMLMRIFELTRLSSRVERAVRSSGARVIHAHFAHEGYSISRTAQRLGLPLVVSLYGSDVTSLPARRGVKGFVFRARLRKTFGIASQMLAISESIAESAIALGAPRDKVRVHHVGMAVPTPTGPARVRDGIIFVGRMVAKKGLSHLLEAVDALPPDLRTVRVTVVGDGPLRSELEASANQLGLNTAFLGFRDQPEMLDLMRSHILLCAPSITADNGDAEGLPTVLVQAAASGLPVVGYAHGGIPEIVHSGVNGILAEEGDVAALGVGLTRLLTDSGLRHRMSAAALKITSEGFDEKTQGNRLDDLYSRLADSS